MGNALGLQSSMITDAKATHLSNTTAADIMPITPPSIETVRSEPEDPWDWSVEQVIDAACYHKDSLMAGIDTSELVLTDPQALEQQLRKNSVRGLTFLKELDRASLREELNMQNLGDRSSVLHLIQSLRRKSRKYKNYLHAEAAERPTPAFDNRFASVGREQSLGSPLSISPGNGAAARLHGSLLQHSPIAPASRTHSWVQEPYSPSKVSSLGQSLPDERPLTIPLEAPSLGPPKLVKPGIPTVPLHEPAPADQGHIHDSSDVFGGEQDGDVRPRIPDSDALEFMRGDPSEAGLDPRGTTARAGETFVVDETGRKRRRLILGSAEPLSTPTSAESLQNDVGITNGISVSNVQHLVGPSTFEAIPATNNKHDLSQLTAIEDFDNAKPTLILPGPIPSASTDLDQKSDTGVVVVDDKGRKRIRPFLVSPMEPAGSESVDIEGSSSNIQQSTSTFPGPGRTFTALNMDRNATSIGRSGQARSPKHAYLGPSALDIDRIFYGDTPLDQEIQDDFQVDQLPLTDGMVNHSENFTILSTNRFGSGQRTYVNGQIQRFLRSAKPKKFRNNGREVTGIVPYSESLARKHQPLSMTIYEKSSGGYIASRSNRSAWHDASEESFTNEEDDPTTFNFPEVFVQPNDDPLDPDRLEKWKYLEADDEVLPVYGDSGSDCEYDLETWREMEREDRKLGRPSAKQSRNRNLEDAQVNAVIDRALEQFVEDWQVKRAPKLQRVAWKCWHKFRRNQNKEARVIELTAKINHLGNLLQNLRKEILKESWSSEKQVLKQTKSMEETVFNQKHAEWQMSIVKLERAPEKPAPSPQKLKSKETEATRQALKDGEEDTGSGSHDPSDSDEEMDDFIVSDDDANEDMGLNDEMMVAEAGIADDSQIPMTLDSDDETPTAGTPTAANDAGSLVKNPLFNSRRISPPMSKPESAYIDLTQLSDPVELEVSGCKPEPESKLSHRIRTPPLDAVDDTDSSFHRYRKKPVEFRRPPIDTEIINLESDTEGSERNDKTSATQGQLPAFDEVTKISEMDAKWLEERQDRKRLLIWSIARCPKELRQSALTEIDRVPYQTMEANVWESLSSLMNDTVKSDFSSLRNGTVKDEGVKISMSDAYMLIASWFITWTIPVKMNQKGGIRRFHLATAIDDVAGFSPFYAFLRTCMRHYTQDVQVESLSQNSAKDTPLKRVLLEDSADRSQGTPVKKRKYEVQQSQEAMDLQYKAQQRVRQQEIRKKELEHRFKAFSVNDEDPTKVIINLSKEDDHDFIFINPKIGQRIQDHQKDGVQFMWRELTADHKNLQGCLLSHTMGLGKTMQVITLLVTIAEAAKSTNDRISSQVPPALRKSQTLVLCPPALLDNWYEEFLMWAPDPFAENVGAIRNVTSAMTSEERTDEIGRWHDDGGVLLLGYPFFRSMVGNSNVSSGQPSSNAENKKKRTSTASDQRMTQILLETPNLVVADEAHMFKGLTTSLNKAMNRISTTSRVALTGSPLSNNLDEYYAVIDWIAPNYLGKHIHFKAHYVEPIEEGLYKESTAAQYLTSRKIMKALQLNLEPKVQRADNSVLKESLQGKVEFLIRLPLTDLQTQIYRDYVNYLIGTVGITNASQTTLFAWLQDSRVLCNHPKIFEEKLRQRLQAARSKPEAVGDGNPPKPTSGKKKKKKKGAAQDEPADLDEEDCDSDLPIAVTEKLLAICNAHPAPLDSISLSFKMLVLKQILDLAEKANDKALVFSHSLSTLDYVGNMLSTAKKSFMRIDGATKTTARQAMTRTFNQTKKAGICLIATKAGGVGLNMYGANRVIILDLSFNPMHEEQAIGRAYRIGQKKPVFVYRLTIGGTFEKFLINQAIFKQQLATRVVDKMDIRPSADKGLKQYLFLPETVEQEEFTECIGKDELVLDRLLVKNECIRSITLTETFHEEDTIKLSEEQLKEVHRLREDLELRTRDPAAFYAMVAQRNQAANAQFPARHSQFANVPGVGQAPANVTPTTLGNPIPRNLGIHENWLSACQTGVNAINGIQKEMYAKHSSIPGGSDSVQTIGSSSVLPIQDQPNTVVSNTISIVDSASTAGRVTFDFQPREGPSNVSEGQKPDLTAVQPNPPQVRTDNIALVNARMGKQNSISEEARRTNVKDWAAAAASPVISASKSPAKSQNAATPERTGTPSSGKSQKPKDSATSSTVTSTPKNTAKKQDTATPKTTGTPRSGKPPKAMDSAPGSTVLSASKSTAKNQNAATPERTGTPTSGKIQKPTTPSKTTILSNKLAQTMPDTPSRASSNGPVSSKHPPAATTLVTADARRLLRSNSRASSLSAQESNRKRSSTTPSAAQGACSTSFNSSFDSLNDAFLSGSGSNQSSRQRAAK